MKLGRGRIVWAVALLLATGCGQRAAVTVGSEEASSPGAAAANTMAARLPAGTLAYGRLTGIHDLEARMSAVLPGTLGDAAPVRAQLDVAYQTALRAVGQNNPLGLKETTVQQLIKDCQSAHIGLLAPATVEARAEPLPVICLQLGNAATLEAVLNELKAGRQPTELPGTRGCTLVGMPPFEAVIALDERTLALGPNAGLRQLLAGASKSLTDTAAFQEAHGDLGARGDLFVFLNVAAIKDLARRTIEAGSAPAEVKAQRQAEIANMPFRQVGCVAARMNVDGTLALAAYSEAGQQFPDFLVRTPRAKKLPARIPAEAALTFIGNYDGGKKTRQGFVGWLQEETKRGGGDVGGMPRAVAGALAQNLERLESDVVVKVKGVAEDLWLAAIPVKTEMAVTLAPDAKGRWGALFAFDIEDRAQADKLVEQIFVAGKGAGLPWKQTEHAGLTIHYLDLAAIIERQAGASALPKPVADLTQLQIGYALGDELFLAGSVELIKFAHRPQGRTLADVLSVQGVDGQGAVLYNFQPGQLLHSLARVEELAALLQPFVRQIPRTASYSISLSVEKERAMVRSNVPLAALTTWGVTQWLMGRAD